jgi:hypothetical protein
MGFLTGTASLIRGWFRFDKEQASKELAKGSTASGPMYTYGRDMLQAFGYDAVAERLTVENDLMSRYADYEEMDEDAFLSPALDIFADDSTQPNEELKRTVWVTSPDRTLQNILDRDLFQRTLRLDEEIWEIARTLCKYGNDFEELLVAPSGVVGLNFLPPATMRRVEGSRGELYGFVQDFRGRQGWGPKEFKAILAERFKKFGGTAPDEEDIKATDRNRAVPFEDWEVVHFRLRGRYRRSAYGHSVLEAGRWIFKRLGLIEDSALVYRLQRAPERFAFYVDVGDLPPAEALAYVNRVKQMYKKKKIYDPQTGKLNLKWDGLGPDDDFWIPRRKGQDGARVEVMGSPQWQSMDDINYFRDRLFAAVKVPKSYLGQDEGASRQVLSSEDVRFARTILRVQLGLKTGLHKLTRVHLAALDINPYDTEYNIHLTVPSAIYHLAQIEVQNARADLAARLQAFVSERWILQRIFDFTDEEIIQIRKEKERDDERRGEQQARMQASSMQYMNKAAAAATPAAPTLTPAPQQSPGQAPAGVQQQPSFGQSESVMRALASGHPEISSQFAARVLRNRKTSGSWERDLLSGDRESEKRAEENFEKLLKNDEQFAKQIRELSGFMQDLRSAMKSR